ncbi:MAG: putative endo-1,4-beta-xylanase 1 precursor [Rhodanobacteraceae bacterium]|nr:MAG: putative endo-1,4-beta-xylanase 1 precursor [Rhodanobacteraceae bacterium]
MRTRSWPCLLLLLFAPLALAAQATSAPLAPHRVFRVTLDGASTQMVSGRLLLFALPAKEAAAQNKDGKVTEVDISEFQPTQTAVAAMEVHDLAPGASVLIDADALAFPEGFSKLAAGDYDVQAVLDVNHDYNYSGRGAGDLVSDVTTVPFDDDASVPTLRLTRALTETMQPWTVPADLPAKRRAQLTKAMRAAQPHSHALDFTSPALSAFWGRPIQVKGWVLLPPGYDKDKSAHYPTVYFTHGFGGDLAYLTSKAAEVWTNMADGTMPPMIWVFLDEHTATGTHEFADSVNNGPWGTALTAEVIPYLESHYRMDAKAGGRFLTGHSSGGWATLWLQVRYPKIFGGTWSTSPDPSDFHDFTGPDLYAPNANVYTRPDGTPYPLVRMKGKVVTTFKQFAQLERVLGPYGGQMASFDWVFSPRGPDGRPQQMFDRETGAVNPEVANYWRDHYDIAYRIQTHWPQLKPDLDGKIHLIVGTADTFYLDGAAHRLKGVLDKVGAHAEVQFLRGKTHGNLYAKGKDSDWLEKQIAWAMYHAARPDAKVPAAYRHELTPAIDAAETAAQ